MSKPFILIILDGWGIAPQGPGNAVTTAKTPNMNQYWAAYPHTQLVSSGEAVGLPPGEAGNSETGHLNLGAGQVVFQDLPRINRSIADGSFFLNASLNNVVQMVRTKNSKLHLMGLVGAGGVHSSLEHIFALIHFAYNQKIKKLYLHLFTDGRDSPPASTINYLSSIDTELQRLNFGRIATLCGRYFAMDRDNRWERTLLAYNLLTLGKGKYFSSYTEAINKSYAEGKNDEFIEPIVLEKNGLIENDDGVIFFNFRVDRPRQLTKAFVLPNFETMETKKMAFDPYAEKYGLKLYQSPVQPTTTFKREKILSNLVFVTMTEYEKGLPVEVAFPPESVKIPLARVLAENNLRQLHISETEKERFVTYYFDGLREQAFPGEDWIEIPSPNVATYDLKPEMSACEVTAKLISLLKSNLYDFILVNFANPDMIGHTGVIKAGIRACEVVDECLGKIVKTTINLGGGAVITADHGNVEEMINLKTGGIDTEHSSNPVPFILIGKNLNTNMNSLSRGILADVAPTILDILKIEKPGSMLGRSFLK